MRTLRALGWLAAGAVALAVGLVLAWQTSTVTAINCYDYDDEGQVAAAGSAWDAVMCQGRAEAVWAVHLGIVASVVVALAVVVIARRAPWAPDAPWVAITLLVVGPAMVVVALAIALPQDCLGGPDGTEACERQH